MTEKGKKRVILASALIAAAWFGWNMAGTRAGRELPRYGELPEFEGMIAHSEKALNRKDLLGTPWIADFIFTRCAGPCPILSVGMSTLQRDLPKEVGLVTFTVDPANDTPDILRRYARSYGADSEKWRFVRMGQKELYNLVFAGFKLPVLNDPEKDPGSRVTHTTKMVLIDGQGVIRGYYDGTSESSIKAIRRDAARLLEEGRSV